MTAGQSGQPYTLGTPVQRPSSDGAGVRTRPAGTAVGQVGGAGHAEEVVAVKVWQLPVRVIHWGLVAAIAVLTVTGLYIGTPLWAPGNRQLMHDVRSLHIFSGYVFIALLVGRVIFMFTGNRYASWRQFLPVQRHRRALVKQSLKYYLFLDREAPPVVGHNPLAGLTYLVLILMFTVQSITGVALEAIEDKAGLGYWFTGWIFDLLSLQTVRFVHHLITWLTLGFVVHHVYSAILVDHEERGGVISSIVTGWKTVPKSRLKDPP
jgi:Ni/Fe-hydrogenase 1 B-type cytochrome subunit